MTSSIEPKKILYQLVSPLHVVAGASEVERRQAMLRRWASPSVSIDIASPQEGPPVIESQIDAALVFANLHPVAPQWTPDGYGAVIIGCFSDPGVEALREMTSAAVIGPGEAALWAAAQFGERFSVLSSDPTPQGLRRRIRAMGLGDAFHRMIGSANQCVGDGADVIVLGCLAMCFVEGLVETLQQALGVPVINPVIAGIKSAEASLSYGISNKARPAKEAV